MIRFSRNPDFAMATNSQPASNKEGWKDGWHGLHADQTQHRKHPRRVFAAAAFAVHGAAAAVASAAASQLRQAHVTRNPSLVTSWQITSWLFLILSHLHLPGFFLNADLHRCHIRIQAWSQCLTCKKTWKKKTSNLTTSQRCCMISYWLISSMNPSFGGGSHASQGCMWGCMWYHGHTSKKVYPKKVLPEVPHLASRDISTQQVGHCYQQHLHRHRHVALQRGGGLAPQN